MKEFNATGLSRLETSARLFVIIYCYVIGNCVLQGLQSNWDGLPSNNNLKYF